MRIRNIQVVAALVCAIAFLLAFMAAGVAAVSLLFAGAGAVILAWLVYTLAKRALTRPGARELIDRG